MGALGKQLAKGFGNAATGGMSGIIDQGVGMLGEFAFGDYMRNQEYEQYKKTADYQHMLSEQAANKAFERQMEMYNKTKQDNLPGTKVAEFQKTGLNVGMMYGQNGGVNMMGQLGGGTQANPTGGQMGKTGGVPRGGMVDSQLAIMEEQRENIKANTNQANANANLANAEADKKRGVDTEEAQSRIDYNKAQEELAKAGKIGQDIVNEKLEIEKNLAEATFDDNVDITKLEKKERIQRIKVQKQQELQIAKSIVKMNSEISLNIKNGELVDQQVENAKLTFVSGLQDLALTSVKIEAERQGIKLTKEQIKKVKAEIDKIDASKITIDNNNNWYTGDKIVEYGSKIVSAGCLIAGVYMTATGVGAAAGLPLIATGAAGLATKWNDGEEEIFIAD